MSVVKKREFGQPSRYAFCSVAETADLKCFTTLQVDKGSPQYAEIYGFARLITEILILKSMNGMREFR